VQLGERFSRRAALLVRAHQRYAVVT